MYSPQFKEDFLKEGVAVMSPGLLRSCGYKTAKTGRVAVPETKQWRVRSYTDCKV